MDVGHNQQEGVLVLALHSPAHSCSHHCCTHELSKIAILTVLQQPQVAIGQVKVSVKHSRGGQVMAHNYKSPSFEVLNFSTKYIATTK